jgi:hypothetical protein
MSTRKIVPRADNEGGIGSSLKRWASGYFKELYVGENILISSVIVSYKTTFNATTDWVLDGDVYSCTINHLLNTTSVMVQSWETTGNTLIIVSSEVVDANNIKIKVASDPDARFAGRVIVLGV